MNDRNPRTDEIVGRAGAKRRRFLWIIVMAGLGLLFSVASIDALAWSCNRCGAVEDCTTVLFGFLALPCGSLIRNPPWSLVSGVAATPSLLAIWLWRTRHKDEDIEHRERELNQRKNQLDQEGRDLDRRIREECSKRFSDAAKLLSELNLEAKLGAIYSLEALANEFGEEVGRVIELLCGFLRENAKKPTDGREKDPNWKQPILVQETFKVLCRIDKGDYSSRVDLRKAYLHKIEVIGGTLRNATLIEVDLSKSTLSTIDLRGAILNGADLSECELPDAKLGGAELIGTNLRGAWLENANFEGAALNDAILFDTNLEDAVLDGSFLYGTDIRCQAAVPALALSNTSLRGARRDAKTIFPEAFNWERAGVIPGVGDESNSGDNNVDQ